MELSNPAFLSVGGLLTALVLWISWRQPTWLLVAALALLAARPELLWGGPAVSTDWNVHHSVLAYALLVNALHYGVRRKINWPVLALIVIFGTNLLFGELHPGLTLGAMVTALAMLALPFCFTQVEFEPGSRRALAMTIALAPLLSVVVGGIWGLLGVRSPVIGWQWGAPPRLEGASGNAAIFGMLAFVGFAVAIHEAGRPGRWYASYLALVDLALVILSGTRMAMLASGVLLAGYCAISERVRAQLLQHRRKAAVGVCLVVAMLVVYWPTLRARLFVDGSSTIQMSGRDMIWPLYFEQFELSPIFGRGLGSGFIARTDLLRFYPLDAPHNEYLHLLVIGGAVGFILFYCGIVFWYRELWFAASRYDRELFLALIPTMLLYATTDNVLIYSSGLALYAYLGILLVRPSRSQL